MYIQRSKSKNVNTGKAYTSVLLCTKYREGGKIKTRIEANLSKLPANVILSIENILKSEKETTVMLKDIEVNSCIDYGYVLVLLHLMKQLRIDEVLEKSMSASDATLVKAMIIGKIITSGSKLSIFNWLCREKKICNILGLDMNSLKVNQLYDSLLELSLHQPKIEKKWFRYHQGSSRRIYLYDLTSTYFEGKCNAFAAYGHNRDKKKGKLQMCIGLLTAEDGFPLRIQAFRGNTADSKTVAEQIRSLKKEFGVDDIVFVGDRGMHIVYNLENDTELTDENIHFITGLTHEEIKTLIRKDTFQLSLFSSDLAEVIDDKKRYILSVNSDIERKGHAFLDNCRQRFEVLLENVRKSWKKRCEKNAENQQKIETNPKKYKHLKTELTSKDIKGYTKRVEEAIKKSNMSKYFTIEIIDNQSFTIQFNQEEFDKSRMLCGKYVVYTNVPAEEMAPAQVRNEYKKLQNVEHAFRDLKSDNINIRPIYHYREKQTRGHVLLCMFAYSIIKTLENSLFPFLTQYNETNKTQLSFNDLKAELNNIKMCEFKIGNMITSVKYPQLNQLQKKILELLNIKLVI